MFTLAHDYAKRGMSAYAELQCAEFAAEKHGYAATRHQGFVGTGYFDELAQVRTACAASVCGCVPCCPRPASSSPSLEQHTVRPRRVPTTD